MQILKCYLHISQLVLKENKAKLALQKDITLALF